MLSIIRLRSTELAQHEVAYYFSALALGLLGGLGDGLGVVPAALMGLIVAVMYVAGHPRLLRNYRQQVVLLDSAFTDEVALTATWRACSGGSASGRQQGRAGRRWGHRGGRPRHHRDGRGTQRRRNGRWARGRRAPR